MGSVIVFLSDNVIQKLQLLFCFIKSPKKNAIQKIPNEVFHLAPRAPEWRGGFNYNRICAF